MPDYVTAIANHGGLLQTFGQSSTQNTGVCASHFCAFALLFLPRPVFSSPYFILPRLIAWSDTKEQPIPLDKWFGRACSCIAAGSRVRRDPRFVRRLRVFLLRIRFALFGRACAPACASADVAQEQAPPVACTALIRFIPPWQQPPRVLEVEKGQSFIFHDYWTTRVVNAAFSRDGRYFVGDELYGGLYIWDALIGSKLRVLQVHTYSVFCSYGLVFSPDSLLVASAGNDHKVRIWSVPGCVKQAMMVHGSTVTAVNFSEDGQLIVSADEDGVVMVWRVAGGKLLQIFTGHTKTVWGVAFSSDGGRVATVSADHTMRVWEVASGQCLKVFERHDISTW